jgi:DNA primase
MKTQNQAGRAHARQDNFKSLNANIIKNSLDTLAFYQHELTNAKLKKHGWIDGGLCPFHADNRPGSFKINTETGAFICFACDAKGGDVISFTMHLHGLTFIEALSHLASDWGLV